MVADDDRPPFSINVLSVLFLWSAGITLIATAPDAQDRMFWSITTAGLLWAIGVAAALRGVSAESALRRWAEAAAVLAFAVHVWTAFACFYDWRHENAYRHTERDSGFGPGVFISYAFVLIWSASAFGNWLRPEWSQQNRGIQRAIQGLTAFLMFNGWVVYADGPSRVLGSVVFVGLGCLLIARLRRADSSA